jgi:cellulose synthase/poly-beta-1,6-N-acetylglucosamine synthase-like glycosyltransferase
VSDLLAAFSLVAAVLGLPVWLYLGALTFFSLFPRSPRPPARSPVEDIPKKLVAVVPAHDEETGIAATVHSLLAAAYPPERRSVVVVADNCSDATAAHAAAAGARVIERRDDVRRGKGYALELAFAQVLADPSVDGVVVIDADTVVAPDLWHVLSARLDESGAVQVENRVRNRDATWRTRLLAIALATINGVRSLGRERLGLSVGLKGNGMAFSRRALEEVPHTAHGLVEDVEHAVQLGLAGIRVVYAHETWIASESPEGSAAAV